MLGNSDPYRFKTIQIDFLVAADKGTDQYYDTKMQELGCRVYKGGLYIIKM